MYYIKELFSVNYIQYSHIFLSDHLFNYQFTLRKEQNQDDADVRLFCSQVLIACCILYKRYGNVK